MVNERDLLPQPAFGRRLRRLRLQRGLKQADLADGHGLSASYVSRIEAGTRAAPPHVAQLIAERLGVDITALTDNREAELARLLADGQTSLAVGNSAGALEAFTQALSRAEGAPLAIAWSIRHGLVTALANLGQLAQWRVHQNRHVQLAAEADAPHLQAQAHHGLSNCLRLAGDIGAAYAAARTAHELAGEHGLSLELRALCMMALIAAEVETGRGTEASRHAEELLELLKDDVSATVRAQARWTAAMTLASRGRHREAVELMDLAMAELSSGEDLITWARLRLAAVSIRQRAGEPLADEWRASYRDATTVLRLAAVPIYVVQLDVIEARIAAAEGRTADALARCEAALARSDLLSFRDRARAGMLAAQLRAGLGEPEQALAELRSVAEGLTEAGALDLAAEAWQAVADMALAGRERPV